MDDLSPEFWDWFSQKMIEFSAVPFPILEAAVRSRRQEEAYTLPERQQNLRQEDQPSHPFPTQTI